MTDLAAPPAGWYPDPVDDSHFRWWTGAGWTPHIHERAVVVAEPAYVPFGGLSVIDARDERLDGVRILPHSPRNKAATIGLIAAIISAVLLLVTILLGLPAVADLLPALVALIASVSGFRTARSTNVGLVPSFVAVLVSVPVAVYSGWTIIAAIVGIPSPADLAMLNGLVDTAGGH